MKEFWNNRYADEAYAYGINPNSFFESQLKKLKKGRILLPAEGEGRNAVFAAKMGWFVKAFDISDAGREKAIKLAEANEVSIDYEISSYNEFKDEPASFDCLGLIYAHMPGSDRERYHRKMVSFLKPGGIMILEGFSKQQINRTSGGPKNADMLFSKEELSSDFESLNKLEITSLESDLQEGPFHEGRASIIRVTGIR